jgi:hypothetical protein
MDARRQRVCRASANSDALEIPEATTGTGRARFMNAIASQLHTVGPSNSALLRILHLGSPALPVGGIRVLARSRIRHRLRGRWATMEDVRDWGR